jgi:hypothetical protein
LQGCRAGHDGRGIRLFVLSPAAHRYGKEMSAGVHHQGVALNESGTPQGRVLERVGALVSDSVERGPGGSLDSVDFDVTKAARADLIA